MRLHIVAVAVVLAVAVPAVAKKHERQWQTGMLVDLSTHRGSRIIGTMTNGTGEVVEGRSDVTYYTIETPQYTYVASREIHLRWDRVLVLTVNAPVTFAVEGDKVYLLDRKGKEHKLTLEKKILRAQPSGRPGNPKPER